MTIPTMMNCNHSSDGWCLPCVSRLGLKMDRARDLLIRCWKAGHRDGWQNGETNTECFDAVNDFLSDEMHETWERLKSQ